MSGIQVTLATALKTHEAVFGGVILLASIALVFVMIDRAKKGKVPYVRRLPAIDGLDHAIDRCAELGKPAYLEVSGTLRGDTTVMVSAALSLLPYIARRCAKAGTRLLLGYHSPEILPNIRTILEGAAAAENKPGFFNTNDLIYLVRESGFYEMQLIEAYDCRAAICIGRVALQAVAEAEANKSKGAICIQGTSFMNQIHAVGVLADYNLIGDELYAAASSLSGDSDSIGTLRINDFIKIITLLLVPVLYIAVVQLGIQL